MVRVLRERRLPFMSSVRLSRSNPPAFCLPGRGVF